MEVASVNSAHPEAGGRSIVGIRRTHEDRIQHRVVVGGVPFRFRLTIWYESSMAPQGREQDRVVA